MCAAVKYNVGRPGCKTDLFIKCNKELVFDPENASLASKILVVDAMDWLNKRADQIPTIKRGDFIDAGGWCYIWSGTQLEQLDYSLDPRGSVPANYVWSPLLIVRDSATRRKSQILGGPFYWQTVITHNFISWPCLSVRHQLARDGTMLGVGTGIKFDSQDLALAEILDMNNPMDLAPDTDPDDAVFTIVRRKELLLN